MLINAGKNSKKNVVFKHPFPSFFFLTQIFSWGDWKILENFNNSTVLLITNEDLSMAYDGINVVKTTHGLQLSLDGDMYKKIAQNWEEGKVSPFFSILKEFIKRLEEEYSH